MRQIGLIIDGMKSWLRLRHWIRYVLCDRQTDRQTQVGSSDEWRRCGIKSRWHAWCSATQHTDTHYCIWVTASVSRQYVYIHHNANSNMLAVASIAASSTGWNTPCETWRRDKVTNGADSAGLEGKTSNERAWYENNNLLLTCAEQLTGIAGLVCCADKH